VTRSSAAGTIHEVTNHRSTVVGEGATSRVIKQYNCTSIEPGTFTAKFLGFPDLTQSDLGGVGMLTFQYVGETISGYAICTQLEAEFQVGELIQWTATFQLNGF